MLSDRQNFSHFLDGFCSENPFLFNDSYKSFVYIVIYLYAQMFILFPYNPFYFCKGGNDISFYIFAFS